MANRGDLFSGLIVAGVGALFALGAFAELPIGTTFRMGPGYFPAAVGVLIVALGIAIAAAGLRRGAERSEPVRLRGIAFVSAAILAFLVLVKGAGLVPAIAASVVLARLADPGSRIVVTLVLAVVLSAFCAGVFVYGIGLPIALFGPWLHLG